MLQKCLSRIPVWNRVRELMYCSPPTCERVVDEWVMELPTLERIVTQ